MAGTLGSHWRKFAATIGFFCITLSTTIAYSSPAPTYELSLYSSTPLLFWCGIGVAFLISILLSLYSDGMIWKLALFLGILSFFVVVALPLTRNYHFYGPTDSLTHLGYVRDIAQGDLSALNLVYPGFHLSTILTDVLTAASFPRSMLYLVLTFAMVYVLFIPLTLRSLYNDPTAVVIGLFSSFFFLPINHIATHYMQPHPYSQTILLFPLAIFLLLKYRSLARSAQQKRISRFGILLAFYSVSILLYHLLQAVNLALAFLGAAAVNFYFKRKKGNTYLPESISYHTVFLCSIIVLWVFTHTDVFYTIHLVWEGLLGLLNNSSGFGSVVTQRSSSLGQLGISLPVLFLQLFLVAAVYSVLALLGGIQGLRSPTSFPRFSLVLVVGIGLLFLFSIFLFVGRASVFFFRIHGAIMVLVTILGGATLFHLFSSDYRLAGFTTDSSRIVLALLLSVFLVHSVAVIYASPYMYKPNPHVTTSEFDGYQTSLEYHDPSIQMQSLRGEHTRFKQGLYGTSPFPPNIHLQRQAAIVCQYNLWDIADQYDEPHYLVITRRERLREFQAYRQVRYSKAELHSLRSQTAVHRILTNGEFTQYYITTNETKEQTPC